MRIALSLRILPSLAKRPWLYKMLVPHMHREIFEGQEMSFLVLGRAEVATFKPSVPYIVISFTDPTYEDNCDRVHPHKPAEIAESEHRVAVLRQSFFDVSSWNTPWPAMTVQQAEKVAKFVAEHLDKIQLIIVHCEAGISRSSGCAAALSHWLQKQDDFFYKHYLPNSHVRRYVLEACESINLGGKSEDGQV